MNIVRNMEALCIIGAVAAIGLSSVISVPGAARQAHSATANEKASMSVVYVVGKRLAVSQKARAQEA
jgi:hypothetical protein